jgi:DNA mismatch repair protein MutS
MTKDNKSTKTTKQPKITISDEYFQYMDKYQAKYGKKTIVIMQVGSFHEIYSCNIRKKNPDIYQIADILNLIVSRKDKSEPESESNHLMCGWPCVATSKFIKLLIDNNYTVVVIDQTTPPPNPLREVTGVYSPSTYIDNQTHENKYLMSLYIEINSSLTGSKPNISIGMCAVDSSTGDVSYYETHAMGLSEEALQETQRFYHYYRPVELIVYQIDNTGTINLINPINSNNKNTEQNQEAEKPENVSNKLLDKIDILPNQIMFTYSKINPMYCKVSYQNTLLKKIYTDCGMISPIEFLDLNKNPYSVISLVVAYDYIHQHNENLIKELKRPKYFNEHKYMVLGNNAQYQLNIIDYYNWEKLDTKFQSLNDVINNCVSPMGKRTLKHRLCAPYTNPEIINKYYEQTDKIMENNLYQQCRDILAGVCDLDKLFRKLSIKFIQPYELYSICDSFTKIVNLTQLLLNSNLKKDLFEIIDKKSMKQFNESINYLTSTFDIDKLKVNNLIEVRDSFYLKGVHKSIDELSDKIEKSIGFIDKLASVLEQYDPSITLSTKHNDRDGYYLSTTKIRGQKLKELIESDKNAQIKITDKTSINKKDLVFTFQTSTAKISYPGLSDHSDELEELYNELNVQIKNTFYSDMSTWYSKYSPVLKCVVGLVIEIDLIANNAFVSSKYHYVRPKIFSNSENYSGSSIKGKNLRHPIIERIIDYEYVPHDINLNDGILGNMIYGCNSAGKSSLMKAVGVCLIMAQCGLYVPADDFEYNIFESLYTRISGNDNLFKGQSSFIIEMNELRSILKKANEKTLIIGDEICRGTEYLSANAIVAATILKLIDLKAKFLFATHLHDLVTIDKIKELESIKFFYLSVEKVGDELVFNRKMIEGTGEQIYGITIAKYILDDPIFIKSANELKNELLERNNIQTKLVSDKKSNYNNEIYMDECSICGERQKLETHHINFQRDFVNSKNGLIHKEKKYITKDSSANLVNLCQKCHDELHAGKFEIESKVKTTKGTKVKTK